jgi:hypothetical protein
MTVDQILQQEVKDTKVYVSREKEESSNEISKGSN